MNETLYWISTIMYISSGLLGIYFALAGYVEQVYFLLGIGLLIMFVSFDNVFCVERKHKYTIAHKANVEHEQMLKKKSKKKK